MGEAGGAVYARREGVVLREVAGEHLLVPIRKDVADLKAIFALNGVGLRIWELLDGERVSIEGHLATCAACAKRAELERHNQTVVRAAAREGWPPCPEALRTRGSSSSDNSAT